MAFVYRTPRTPIPLNGRTGVLLINLGTPDNTGYWGVRRYLSEFLSDRRVIEAPSVVWQPILQGAVLARRPFESGANYARIWDKEKNASPLRVYTEKQAELLKERLSNEDVPVAWGMRYGKPSIAHAVDELMDQGCDRIISIPLYPQYSATTTATANDQLFRALMKLRGQPSVLTVPSFPDHPLFIKGLEESVRRKLASLDFKPQRLVVSFHGLPKICVEKGDRYREECERTTAALRTALDLTEEQMPLTFQSRFGPMEWLKPYTAEFVSKLPDEGVTKIAVITPGFMADCIETLDEIGNELREEFEEVGGEKFALIPCLNDDVAAIDLIEDLTRKAMRGFSTAE
ncbi:ferrochelatase [Neokomagataea thailandica NBRC 106555]|uniref:Ferrochelatase n=2 Tax=Neokomagataea TaxID=1223423 RepID=A0A4Y6V709_9PROT|nr:MULTISPECIES: ferrochelatase [Neokomagataea]QDH24648.1 ferrochelatase [Neokomagataea tanensis]GBR53950.1 ferrochelatase [Neokomagataea thailandica NBRC 106555]